LLDAWQAEAQAAHESFATKQPRGPVTGLRGLDADLGGALAPGLHILHGGPGVGKTAFGLQVATACRFPALYVSCEMPPLELLARITARETGTFLGRLKSGELAPQESLKLVMRAAEAAPQLALVDGGRAYADPAFLQQAALATRMDARRLLVVIDSLHSWCDLGRAGVTEYEALNAALAALRTLAAHLDCPFLVIAERNRAAMKAGGISAGAGTRKIEYGAESVLDLNREDDALEDINGEVPVTLTIQKNRHGVPGKRVGLRFSGRLQLFRETVW
jgi:replicative DNA helicase